jgi:hypothetical protein
MSGTRISLSRVDTVAGNGPLSARRLYELRKEAGERTAREVEPHPEPEVVARKPLADDPVAPASAKWLTLARLNGWRAVVTYARGNRKDARGTKELIHSTALRMRHESGHLAVAVWYVPVPQPWAAVAAGGSPKLSWKSSAVWIADPGQCPREVKLKDLQAHLERASLAREDKEAA